MKLSEYSGSLTDDKFDLVAATLNRMSYKNKGIARMFFVQGHRTQGNGAMSKQAIQAVLMRVKNKIELNTN